MGSQGSSTRPIRCLVAVILAGLTVLGCGGGAKSPTEPAELDLRDQVRLAQSLLQAGRVGEALEVVDEALGQHPDNAQLHSFKGQLNFQAGRYAEAESSFLRAIELDSFLTDAHNFLGAVYAEMGRLTEAEEQYRIALSDPAYPKPEMIYLNLGMLYARQGRDEEAVGRLRQALELNPKFYRGHFELASLLDRIGNLEEAAREYEVATPGYRNVGDFHYRLGFAYFRLGRMDKARDSLNRAITIAPGSNSAAQADELLRVIAN